MSSPIFLSSLAPFLNQFVQYKRALNRKYCADAEVLRQFDRYIQSRDISSLLAPGLKSRATNYCWPDIAIAQNGETLVILEIEQTGIVSPGKIGGKLLPISLSAYLCNEEIGRDPVSISRETTFIQVVNTALLQPTTRKLLQYENLETHIRNILPLGCIC